MFATRNRCKWAVNTDYLRYSGTFSKSNRSPLMYKNRPLTLASGKICSLRAFIIALIKNFPFLLDGSRVIFCDVRICVYSWIFNLTSLEPYLVSIFSANKSCYDRSAAPITISLANAVHCVESDSGGVYAKIPFDDVVYNFWNHHHHLLKTTAWEATSAGTRT